MIFAPYFAATFWQTEQGSIGRRSPDLPILQITIVFTKSLYLESKIRSECWAVPSLPFPHLSSTFQFLECELVACPRTSPFLSNAIAEILYVQGEWVAFSLSISSMQGSIVAFFAILESMFSDCFLVSSSYHLERQLETVIALLRACRDTQET